MKRNLCKVLACIAAVGVVYGLGVFVSLEPNVFEWGPAGRFLFATWSAMAALLAALSFRGA